MNWLDSLLVPIAVIYFLVISALFIYGLNFFYLAWQAHKYRQNLYLPSPKSLERWPFVTVQLPIYNERYVASRSIKAAAALDYPRQLLEIQVLDDSTDDTAQLIAETVRDLRAQGVNVKHLHRTNRRGFKAGALNDALEQAQGEFMAIFDADFLPPPDFLRRILPHFDSEDVAFVQARWGHLNRNYSLLTLLQSLSIDAHFAVEQLARAHLGYWFNFNGTAGVWRKSAILDAGGWKAETLTEDLDLSYRAFLRGWKARYAGEIETPAELPVSMAAYRRQQHRWARGSLECAARFIPLIWHSPITLPRKIEALLHLTGYGVHLLLFALAILYPLVLLLSLRYSGLVNLFGIAALMNFTAFAPTIYFAVAQHALGRRWPLFLPVILFMTVLGAGMMVNTLRAALQIIFSQKGTFERTPKYGITRPGQTWDRHHYRLRLDWLIVVEISLAMLNLITTWLAFRLGNYMIGVYAAIFALGLLFVSGMSLAQSASTAIHHRTSFHPGNSIAQE